MSSHICSQGSLILIFFLFKIYLVKLKPGSWLCTGEGEIQLHLRSYKRSVSLKCSGL